ncbi:MAG: hypothetical protein IPK78_19290 [Rhodospirillales bacterium]|nr:hypothetical protein [Rhodospirillales bacterium]
MLLVLAPDHHTLLNDAFGLRQLVYTVGVKKGWYASDPALLADLLNLKPDPEAEKFLQLIKIGMGMREYYFPGDVTRYAEVKHLQANHFLDLKEHSHHRFFPCDPIEEQPLEDVAHRAATMLRNIVEGAHERFPLALALTAGMDSRLVLAATKSISQNVLYYTIAHPLRMKDQAVPSSDPDIKIAARLCAKLGLSHQVVPARAVIDGTEFSKLLAQHTSMPHRFFGEGAQGLLQEFRERRVALTGSCSETARLKWYRKANLDTVTADKIADLYGWGLGNEAFVRRTIDEWLATAKPRCEATGFQLLDLFYWEYKMGRWLAQALIEQDLAQETLCPFDCRELITTMMATQWKDRSFYTNFRLQRAMLAELWPECLSEAWKTDPKVKKIKSGMKAHLRVKIFGKGYPTSFLRTLHRSWSI